MLVHSVFFWLRTDLSADERADFRAGVDSLAGIESASAVYVGSPSATEQRPMIDNSYDVGLTVFLEDIAAHDAYQVDSIHNDFIQRFATYWTKVKIYDAD